MQIKYQIKDNNLSEITWRGVTFKVGELTASYNKGYFKIIKISKMFDGKNFIDLDENKYYETKPNIQVKKLYSSTYKEVKGKASRTSNVDLASLIKVGIHLQQKEKARDREIDEYNKLKTIIDENQI